MRHSCKRSSPPLTREVRHVHSGTPHQSTALWMCQPRARHCGYTPTSSPQSDVYGSLRAFMRTFRRSCACDLNVEGRERECGECGCSR